MLTTQQKQTLKADILANSDLNAFPNTADGAFEIAAAYNTPASPTYYVWRTSVPVNEIMLNGFDWTRVDNLTVGKARIWDYMTRVGTINPSQANVRAGVNACFSVSGADAPNRQAVFDHCAEPATRLEKIFATGTGTAPTDLGVGPSTRAVTGPISYSEVQEARNL